MLSLAGLLTSPALSVRWWGGLLCGLLSLVSMGSGLLIAAPLAAVAVLRLVSKISPRRDALVLLLTAFFIGALGTFLRTPTPWHDTLHAKKVAEFLLYAARYLAWPLPQFPWLAPLFWAPWFSLLFLRLRTLRVSPSPLLSLSPSSDFLLAAGTWVLLQVAAVSYSRAGGWGLPASRYGDIVALGLVISFFSLVQLAATFPARRRTFATLATLHLAVVAACIALATREVLAGPLPAKKTESVAFERSVQAFVLTDDYEKFAKSPLPFPLAEWLARIVRRPDIRAILPTSVRAPLRVEGFSEPSELTPPALIQRRTRHHTAAAEWSSPPIPDTTLGWWKIETAGPAFSTSGPSPLRVVAGSTETAITPTRPPLLDQWRAAYLPAPAGTAIFLARSDSSERWLAFSEPVEMSALSYRTWQLTKHGTWLLGAGLFGLLSLPVGAHFALRRPVHPSDPL
ncbi:MAG: hypothetical protein CK548_01360 [Opitutia bacterium]|nr:hypothetical protein [Opitutaceae bacterium]PHX73400.1 MAG: hypothetical protein CK548_01360 [Opitutae bacterium]